MITPETGILRRSQRRFIMEEILITMIIPHLWSQVQTQKSWGYGKFHYWSALSVKVLKLVSEQAMEVMDWKHQTGSQMSVWLDSARLERILSNNLNELNHLQSRAFVQKKVQLVRLAWILCESGFLFWEAPSTFFYVCEPQYFRHIENKDNI